MSRYEEGTNDMSELAERIESAVAPAFITHRRADRDSLGAALGLHAILGAGTICTPAGVTNPARALLEGTDAPICDGTLPDAFDEAVVLDAPSTDRISPVSPESVLLIDHHEPADLADNADALFVDTDAGATSELVARLSATAGWGIPADAALPLLVGLIDDTGFPHSGGPQTATTAVGLCAAVDDRAQLLPELLDDSDGRDERIASATGVLRSRGYRAGDLFVSFSEVGAHEGTAATRLRAAGVDLAVVCSRQGTEIRVTARASEQLAQQVSLGATLLPRLADEFGGDGGGHDTAGSAAVTCADIDSLVDAVLEILRVELGMTFSEVTW
jgi:nanoRNase/pAp phosphatase (c-di-AMP/oligoRNAs hydrolase)